MTQEDYIQLYEKYLAGKLTPEEERLLEDYKDDFELKELPWSEQQMGDKDETRETIFQDIQTQLKRKKVIRLQGWLVAASIVAALIVAGLYLYPRTSIFDRAVANKKSGSGKEDISPGSNKAILVLSDGSEVALDKANNGLLADDGGSLINKDKTVLKYKRQSSGPGTITYNTVYTPKGGQYQLQLEDGTRVWVNSESRIYFPTAFSGRQRIVELEGEAYFEVAKDPDHPFVVLVTEKNGPRKMKVEVLGTHFNVKAYKDEPLVATLAEGSVKVSVASKNSLVLVPGEQSLLSTENSNPEVRKANLKEALAWKNGYFVFDHENIQYIMKKLSRWYDIEPVYQSKLDNKNFVGTISREENLSEVLRMLEMTGTIKFEIEGKKVFIK